MSSFLRDFDSLMEDIITDYTNLDPSPDTSEGSIVYIKAACLASMLWGLYRFQDYIAKQPFPDTCDTDNLNHWGSIYGIARETGESDSAYAARILSFLAAPPEGGTANDYATWAKSVTSTINVQENFLSTAVDITGNTITLSTPWSDDSQSIPNVVTFSTTGTLPSGLALSTQYYIVGSSGTLIQVASSRGGSALSLGSQGTGTHSIVPASTPLYHAEAVDIITPMTVPTASTPGTVTVVVDPNTTDNILDSADKAIFISGSGMTTLNAAIKAYIETVRPVTASGTMVLASIPVSQSIEIMVTPSTLSSSVLQTMASDVSAFMDTLGPGQILYTSKLQAICVNDGATSATCITPSIDVTPTGYQIITLSGTPNVHV